MIEHKYRIGTPILKAGALGGEHVLGIIVDINIPTAMNTDKDYIYCIEWYENGRVVPWRYREDHIETFNEFFKTYLACVVRKEYEI